MLPFPFSPHTAKHCLQICRGLLGAMGGLINGHAQQPKCWARARMFLSSGWTCVDDLCGRCWRHHVEQLARMFKPWIDIDSGRNRFKMGIHLEGKDVALKFGSG